MTDYEYKALVIKMIKLEKDFIETSYKVINATVIKQQKDPDIRTIYNIMVSGFMHQCIVSYNPNSITNIEICGFICGMLEQFVGTIKKAYYEEINETLIIALNMFIKFLKDEKND